MEHIHHREAGAFEVRSHIPKQEKTQMKQMLDDMTVPMTTRQQSQMYNVALWIYQVWQQQGSDGLISYFMGSLAMTEEQARKFAPLYHPSAHPTLEPKKISGTELVKARPSSSDIFDALRLTLETWPRNELAWLVMKALFGEEIFNYRIPAGQDGTIRNNKIIDLPTFYTPAGKGLNFGEAAFLGRELIGVPPHVKRKVEYMFSQVDQKVAIDFARMLMKADFLFPPKHEFTHIVHAIERGLKGEELILTGVFCPDYEFRKTGNPSRPYEYTFENVAGGVGLVALQFVRILPSLIEFCHKHNIRYRVELSIADFEANDQKILDRVGVTREQFIQLCRDSLTAFRAALPNVPMELALFQEEWAGGKLIQYSAEALERMKKGDFGAIRACTGKDFKDEVRFLANDRRSFYEKWFDRLFTEAEAYDKVLEQGAEYAAIGRIMMERYLGRPPIQLAGDSPKMQIFNFLEAVRFGDISVLEELKKFVLGVLCAKRVY